MTKKNQKFAPTFIACMFSDGSIDIYANEADCLTENDLDSDVDIFAGEGAGGMQIVQEMTEAEMPESMKSKATWSAAAQQKKENGHD